MVKKKAQKKVHKKGLSLQKVEEDLFVNLLEVSQRRKALLLAVKDSLVMQEEFEKISRVRSEKKEILALIRKKCNEIGSGFSRLKSLCPNVEFELERCEKDLGKLDSAPVMPKPVFKKEAVLKVASEMSKLGQEVPKKPAVPQERFSRIRENLKVIENKLKTL